VDPAAAATTAAAEAIAAAQVLVQPCSVLA